MDELINQKARELYKKSLLDIKKSGIPFMLGGAFAFKEYTGISRYTKDLDLFCYKKDYKKILKVLEKEGLKTEVTDPRWLAKAFEGEEFVDLIFDSGNGICPIDEKWFERSVKEKVLGIEVSLIPAEEMIWQKMFVNTRERNDVPDVMHVMLKRGKELDWKHLYNRMTPAWEILLSRILIFMFIYPSEKDTIPKWLFQELLKRYKKKINSPPAKEKISKGSLLSIRVEEKDTDYEIDYREWGFKDPRP